MSRTPEELFNGQELAASGATINAITLDSNIVIHVGPNREHEFRIEADIEMQRSTSSDYLVVRYDPYNRNAPEYRHITELAMVVTQGLDHAYALCTGALELELSNGTRMTVQPKDRYEAWTYSFGNFILACPPGGFNA